MVKTPKTVEMPPESIVLDAAAADLKEALEALKFAGEKVLRERGVVLHGTLLLSYEGYSVDVTFEPYDLDGNVVQVPEGKKV
jgi:hypothetical protein